MARADMDAVNRRAWLDGIAAIDREHLATVIHTSGTTANPKGAMLSHGNLLFNFEAATQVVDFYETDVFLAFLPLSHIYGRIVDEFVALGRGAAVVFAEALIERLPANMVEVQPTVMGSVPRLYERVYARVQATVEAGSPTRQRIFHWAAGLGAKKYANHLEGKANSPWLNVQLRVADRLVFGKIRARTGGRVRYFVTGSAPLAREIGEFFYATGMLVLEGYGLTETSPFVSINRPDDFVFGTVGRPAPGSEVKIDPETGEILVRGPQIMQGYLNAPGGDRPGDRARWLVPHRRHRRARRHRPHPDHRSAQEPHHPRQRQERLAGADGGRAVDVALRRAGGDPRRSAGLHRGAHRAGLRRAGRVGRGQRHRRDAAGAAHGEERSSL